MKSRTLRLESLEGRDCPAPVVSHALTVRHAPVAHAATHTGDGTSVGATGPVGGTTTPATAVENRVAAFAVSHVGQLVTAPDAIECAALGSAALAAAGAHSPVWVGNGPISNHYGWGALVYQRSMVGGYAQAGTLANIHAGDVIQVDGYGETHADGSWLVAPHHTAIVEAVNPVTGQITVLQQNWNGIQTTTQGVFNPTTMTGGVFSVYRPY